MFSAASGSVINHPKIGASASRDIFPYTIKEVGCKQILSKEVFRLLGIPTGFSSLIALLNKGGNGSWTNSRKSSAIGLLIRPLCLLGFCVEHFILYSVIYFIS